MTDSNLPAKRSSTAIALQRKSSSRFLLGSGVAAFLASAGLFLSTQEFLVSSVLAAVGIGLISVRQLVQKSLNSTDMQLQEKAGAYQKIQDIKKQVSKSKFLENVEAEGAQAAAQADQLFLHYQNLMKVLQQKFEITEITYLRYTSSVETACMAIGENLLHLKGLLENLNITTSAQADLRQQRRDQVQGILRSTDEALRVLESLFHSLSAITTKETHGGQLEESMNHIKELADRAKIYSKS